MTSVWQPVLGLSLLLGGAVLLLPLAQRLRFPFTVLLAVAGIVLGVVAQIVPQEGNVLIAAVSSLSLTSEAVLFIFLPALVFESALSIDAKKLLSDIGPVLFLAVLGLLVSAFAVGLTLNAVTGSPMLVCLLIGAIVSATDPVAVVALFKELGAPKRLAILVEGESLFNDATAIVLFTIISGLLVSGAEPSISAGVLGFLRVFIGGIVVGALMAWAICWLLRVLQFGTLAKVTLTLSLAYLSFVVAEHFLHVSGVMAVVAAALVLGVWGRLVILPSEWHTMEEVWEQLGFWANSVIFLLVGLVVPSLMAGLGTQFVIWLAILIAVALVARAVIIFVLLPLLEKLNWSERVGGAYKAVMFWGGLRGAVSLALALAVLESPALDEQQKALVASLVAGFVLFTLLVQAPSIRLLLSWLGLDQMSAADKYALAQAKRRAWGQAQSQLSVVAELRELDINDAQAVLGQPPMDDVPQSNADTNQDFVVSALLESLMRERRAALRALESGIYGTSTVSHFIAWLDHISDGVKQAGEQGYLTKSSKGLDFGIRFRLAGWLIRRFGYRRWMAKLLQQRLSLLLLAHDLLRQQLAEIDDLTWQQDIKAALKTVVSKQLAEVSNAKQAMVLQYPEYCKQIERRLLGQTAMDIEMKYYRSMASSGVVSGDVLKALQEEVEGKAENIPPMPLLDLGLDSDVLIRKVPLFDGLDDEALAAIEKLLQPVLALPEQVVFRKGDVGECMYFISSGAVSVALPQGDMQLGNGAFFGEMSLLNNAPRMADVVAKGFCEMLRLDAKHFQVLMEQRADIAEQVSSVAARREEENLNR